MEDQRAREKEQGSAVRRTPIWKRCATPYSALPSFLSEEQKERIVPTRETERKSTTVDLHPLGNTAIRQRLAEISHRSGEKREKKRSGLEPRSVGVDKTAMPAFVL